VQNKGVADYKSASINSASPVKITTMLMEGAVKAVKKAQIHYDAGNREKFLHENNRGQLIIGELLSTLDMEAGGEIAQNLQAIYAYCIRTLIEATVEGPEKLEEVILHMDRITTAWKTATAELAAENATPLQPGQSSSVA
jgi:flagellar protein FliS